MQDRTEKLKAAGEKLKAWRIGLPERLTQEAAAKQIGTIQGTWHAWENGQKVPDLHFAFELERITGGAVLASDWAVPRPVTLERQQREERKARRRTRRKAA